MVIVQQRESFVNAKKVRMMPDYNRNEASKESCRFLIFCAEIAALC